MRQPSGAFGAGYFRITLRVPAAIADRFGRTGEDARATKMKKAGLTACLDWEIP